MKLSITDIKKIKARQWLYWGCIVTVAVVHILIYVLFPYSCDDYWYMSSIADYCKGIDRSFPAGDLWACWVDHYYSDNIRLSNIVFTLSLLLPKFIPSLLSGLLVGIMVWQSGKLAGISWRNPLLIIIMTLMIMFLLPWYEEMLTQCFAFNYIWASALSLLLAMIFFAEKQPRFYMSLLLGVLLGAWHEGFAVPLLLGFVAYSVLSRRNVNPSRVAMMVGLMIGVLWLISAPGLQMKVGYNMVQLTMSAVINKMVLYHTPLLLMIVSIVVAMMRRTSRGILRNPMLVALIVVGISGSGLNFITNIGVRTGWVGYLFGIIATINIWHTMKGEKYVPMWSAVKKVSVVILGTFLLAHYVTVVYYTVKIRCENDYVLEQYQKSPDGVVFADVTYDYEASPLAWKKPYFETFTYTLITYWLDGYYSHHDKRLRVIPACLQNASRLNGDKVAGDNPFMIYDGHLYASIKEGDKCNEEDYYDVDFGLTKKRLKFSNFNFVASNGELYYFAFPQRATMHLWIGEIKSINKVR